ncbi:unnamed protein product [Didymodactylos carnosus]|uniref:Uncharacterized protein n=1 Tax=Didymodactylos carnosus TaxID=1234261 RepID=A0A813ZGH9_9BILA|nr:unnamed protein product [Didymodactylos carnosus]CAF0898129.1 unnamed protein product [Didymodactylos carnosus]CAF3638904.1 unnamed protein product [Didymodactylos carnosus]CAF3681043.1 unnamed protein product [Didymodactylos carnosus]
MPLSNDYTRLSRLYAAIKTISQRTKRGLHDVWYPAAALLKSFYSDDGESLRVEPSNNQRSVKPVDGPISIDYINHMLEARKVQKYSYPRDMDSLTM